MKIISASYEILTPIDGEDILKRLELYGRTAYKSEDKITEGSAFKFVSGLVKRHHFSVIEHITITVKFICDRGVSHELARHRLCSLTQESTRYVNYSEEMVFIKPCFWNEGSEQYTYWQMATMWAEDYYNALIRSGAKPEQARSVLLSSLKTEVVCTANLREWRHILDLRCSKQAHPQIREIMLPLLNELHTKIPVIFDDIWEKYHTIPQETHEKLLEQSLVDNKDIWKALADK